MTEATNNTGEPVAWQLQLPDGRVTLEKAFPSWAVGGDGYTITPLYTAPPAAAVVPEWLRSKEAFADRLYAAGWRDHADAQWSGVESLRTELLARLNPAPVEQSAMVPGVLRIQVCKLGRLGAAFDAADTRYAYTYTEQPDNVGAMRLGRAAGTNGATSHGDEIDRGLHLLRALQAEGFGVFQIAAPTPEQPAKEVQS